MHHFHAPATANDPMPRPGFGRAATVVFLSLAGTAILHAANNPEVSSVSLQVENGLTNCMEKRDLTFSATAGVIPHDGDPCDINYKLYIAGPSGSYARYDESDWAVGQTCIFDDYEAPLVPRDGRKNYTLQAYATAQDVRRRFSEKTSNYLYIDVRRLWIEKFEDAGSSGKDWKVVVGRTIHHKGFASDDCVSGWDWDMEDGVPDAWNPTGGTTKEGSAMVIPIAELDRAGPSWFGDRYGTVTVSCVDGEGTSHAIDSTDQTPSAKAKVFFPAMHIVDGEPCWFRFWKNGAVPGLASTEYIDVAEYGESDFSAGIFWDTSHVRLGRYGGGFPVAPTGAHYPGGLTAGGRTFGGSGTIGIDCCAEVVVHENKHNSNASRIANGAADTDHDGCPDADEPALGCVVGNRDTHNLAVIKDPVYATYGDNEFSCLVAAQGATGVAAKDWSFEGKQW